MSRLERIRELFEEVVDLDPEARKAVLLEHSREDADLVRRVEALIEADTRPFDGFEGGAVGVLAALAEEREPEELCGTSFGAYRIEGLIGVGGMAHVFEATRTTDGVERRVALKVLRPELDRAGFIERFERERETLAALEHEHIVAFLDAGRMPDERPYLAMEFVVGEPLTQWAATVGIEERLRLFLRVLAAVQHAHAQLLVHRDLKPSNILVAAAGTPKLLDFGVAGAVQSVSDEGAELHPLTPAYASPEQLRGEAITTASDVYALGVLLHELVAGDLPGSGGDALPPDLACIVNKATEREPTARYRSVDHLADDLRRFLLHEPVTARQSTLAYRARLGALRNRWPLATAGAIFLALVVGWIASDMGRRAAESNANLGWGAHAEARCAAALFEDCMVALASEDPDLASDAAAKLELAMGEATADLPEAETLLRIALARLYAAHGEKGPARRHALRATELARTTPGVGTRARTRAEELLAELDASGG